MAEAYLTDEEQVERIKKWWKDNHRSVIVGVLAGLLLVFGWQYWRQRQVTRQEQASTMYAHVLQANTNSDADRKTRETIVDNLKTIYPRSTYSALATLLVARVSIQDNHLQQTQEQLTWVIDHSRDAVLKQVARLRLARVLLAQKSYDAALVQLDKATLDSFRGITAEIRGDIYVAQGKTEQARQAYQTALRANGLVKRSHPWLPLKLGSVERG